MELGLAGKNAIVTGGSAGIGFACAKALVEEGVNVVIVARNEERLAQAVTTLEKYAKNASAFAIHADLTEEGAANRIVSEAIEHFGTIDILINNAGSARAGVFWDLKDEDFTSAWNLKLLGYIRMVKAVGQHMIEKQSGRILNIIGTGGRSPNPTFLPGGTANAALINFTKGISKDLAKYGVRINAISPAVTATERAERLAVQNAEASGISVEEQKARDNAAIPLGKMVEPKEIAVMALVLVSDVIPSITGSEIIIDGGSLPGL